MGGGTWMRAWRPAVPSVREVLHARMTDHAYPAHAHADWALMLVDEGAVVYELGGRRRIADRSSATLLPPGIAHDGRAAPRSEGFSKRVAYLDGDWMPESVAGLVVDMPGRTDLLAATRRFHFALAEPGEEHAAEHALLGVADVLVGAAHGRPRPLRDDVLARRLRDLLESHLVDGISLRDAGLALGSHPGHLSRSFTASFGMPPHRYLTSRRVDLARELLLRGEKPSAAAASAGFHDQAHLTRHFRRLLGTTPARFAGARRAA
ncbi:AraC family transcriptional regulator [Microbacterium sp. 1P10UB]|uniref:helix-turn-helix transcriptional regulator n=1 Tax=unclassified Microbacterium TaxID=2609290 RepID=UPI0039A0773E